MTHIILTVTVNDADPLNNAHVRDALGNSARELESSEIIEDFVFVQDAPA